MMLDHVWQLIPEQSLLFFECEEASFCYCDGSGETHLLGLFPCEVLKALSHEPQSIEQISAQLSTLCDVACDKSFCLKVQSVLQQLHRLALVRSQ